MKAAIIRGFGPPDVIRIETLPDPTPRFGEIRIAIHAATVNRVLDVALRAGTEPQREPVLPLILGVDCAGIVEVIGEGVTRFKVGQPVAAAGVMPLEPCREDGEGYAGPQGMMGVKRPGGFAERVCVPACKVTPVPTALGFHEAAVVMRHFPTAWNLLVNVAATKPGEWALIMGASGNLGGVGVQVARHICGARVICAAGSRARAEEGLALGAEAAIDYSSQDICAEVLRITGGKGVDVLYDNVGNPKFLPQAFLALGVGGRLVTAGAHAGPIVPIDFDHLYGNRITIRGMPGYNATDIPRCFEAAAQGKIKARIAHILPLAQAAQAHAMMESDPSVGKIVLDPTLG